MDEQLFAAPAAPERTFNDEEYEEGVARPYVPGAVDEGRAQQMKQLAAMMDGFGEVVTE